LLDVNKNKSREEEAVDLHWFKFTLAATRVQNGEIILLINEK